MPSSNEAEFNKMLISFLFSLNNMSLLLWTVLSKLGHPLFSNCKNHGPWNRFSSHKLANNVLVPVVKSPGFSLPDTKSQHSTGTFFLIMHTLFEIQALQTCLIHNNATWESDQQIVCYRVLQISSCLLQRWPILIMANMIIIRFVELINSNLEQILTLLSAN